MWLHMSACMYVNMYVSMCVMCVYSNKEEHGQITELEFISIIKYTAVNPNYNCVVNHC